MRGFVIFLGLLLMLGGGAVAGAQYAPIDLSSIQVLNQVFDQVPGSREFLKTPMALYTGGGTAGFGFLLIIIAAATGGKKKTKDRPVVKPPEMAREKPQRPAKAKLAPKAASAPPPAAEPAPPPPVAPPMPATPKAPPMVATPAPPQPAPVAPPAQPAPPPAAPAAPQPVAAAPVPQRPAPPAAPAAPPPVMAAPAPPKPAAPVAAPVSASAAAAATEAARKPQASAQPPAATVGAPPADPRIVNRKRVQDLVTINDALKAYHAKNGAYPQAAALAGLNERGANWIPGLAPDFVKEIPRDPMHDTTTQYVYVSDGANYKLLAAGVSLVGSPNVEVLGIKIDPTRNPTAESASFGFWTPGFAGA